MFSLPCFKQSDCSKCGRGLFHIQCAKKNKPYHYQQELEDSLETLFILAYSRYDFNISEMYLWTTDYITKTQQMPETIHPHLHIFKITYKTKLN